MFWKKKPFGEDIAPACLYCAYGTYNSNQTMILCKRCGVVSPNYHCRRFQYDPLLRVPKRGPILPSFTSDDFKMD